MSSTTKVRTDLVYGYEDILDNYISDYLPLTGGEMSGNLTTSTDLFLDGPVTEAVHTLEKVEDTGGRQAGGPLVFELDPHKGKFQLHYMNEDSTYDVTKFQDGQSITLMIDTSWKEPNDPMPKLTWPTIKWVNTSGIPPSISDTGFLIVGLWRAAGKMYGSLSGKYGNLPALNG